MTFRFALIFATFASFVWSILEIARHPDKFQWDLKIYYEAPLLLARHLDPYKLDSAGLAFVYPPAYFPIFKTFSAVFTYDHFYWAFLLTKIICFVTLLVVWKKFFCQKTRLDTFLVFTWLGFYATFFLDFSVGNISIFETTILFFGFLCFLKNKPALFVFMVCLVASLKITPIVFLCLLPLSTTRNKWRYFLLGCVGFLAFCLLNLLLFPDLSSRFVFEALRRTNVVGESGYINPSSFALITDVLIRAMSPFNIFPNKIVLKILYLVFAVAVLLKSLKAWTAASAVGEDDKNGKSVLVFFSILVYTIAMPRMKDYAYMLAIPSVLYALENFEIKIPRWLMFLPLILLVREGPCVSCPSADVLSSYTPDMRMPQLFRALFLTLWEYYPLFVAFFFWHIYMQEFKLQSRHNGIRAG